MSTSGLPDHVLDPESGLLVDKHSGVARGLGVAVSAPPAPAVSVAEYPKWVEVHPSHIVRQGDTVSAAYFESAVDRHSGVVKVLVHDKDEEDKALADFVHPGEPKEGE